METEIEGIGTMRNRIVAHSITRQVTGTRPSRSYAGHDSEP